MDKLTYVYFAPEWSIDVNEQGGGQSAPMYVRILKAEPRISRLLLQGGVIRARYHAILRPRRNF